MDREISKKLRWCQSGHYYKPHLIYPDQDKQYYPFMNSSKHSWSDNLIQYAEWTKEDGTKIWISHPITYQSGTFHGSQKNRSTLTKEAYAIYMSFGKMVFYLKEAYVNG